jgi:hypothetical protein
MSLQLLSSLTSDISDACLRAQLDKAFGRHCEGLKEMCVSFVDCTLCSKLYVVRLVLTAMSELHEAWKFERI